MTDILNLYIGNRDSGKTKALTGKLQEAIAHDQKLDSSKFVFVGPERDQDFFKSYPELRPIRNKFTRIEISNVADAARQVDESLYGRRPTYLFLDEFEIYGDAGFNVLMYLCSSPEIKGVYAATSPIRFRRFEEIQAAIDDQHSQGDLLLEFLLISDWNYTFLFNPHVAETYLKQQAFSPKLTLTEGFGLYTELTNLKI